MVARLILALLLAVFAFPAVAPAACHDAPVASGQAMDMNHGGEHPAPVRDDTAMPPHGCIGCIPPSTWIAAPLAPAASHDPVPPVARARVLDIGTGAPPALPPPRGA